MAYAEIAVAILKVYTSRQDALDQAEAIANEVADNFRTWLSAVGDVLRAERVVVCQNRLDSLKRFMSEYVATQGNDTDKLDLIETEAQFCIDQLDDENTRLQAFRPLLGVVALRLVALRFKADLPGLEGLREEVKDFAEDYAEFFESMVPEVERRVVDSFSRVRGFHLPLKARRQVGGGAATVRVYETAIGYAQEKPQGKYTYYMFGQRPEAEIDVSAHSLGTATVYQQVPRREFGRSKTKQRRREHREREIELELKESRDLSAALRKIESGSEVMALT